VLNPVNERLRSRGCVLGAIRSASCGQPVNDITYLPAAQGTPTNRRGDEVKHTIRFTLAALAAATALLSTTTPAHADYDFSKVADPKIPDPIMFWCMGGGSGNLLLGQPGYCDGERYPDGSYWHVVNAPVVRMRMDCVIDNGSPLPPLAPPGGCGGAVT
jgi:hypothetical protein